MPNPNPAKPDWSDLIPPIIFLLVAIFAQQKWLTVLTGFLSGYGICTYLRDCLQGDPHAAEFYEQNATNVVNVPRPRHPEDKSGWDGVRRASEARFIAKDALVMTLPDAFDFAAKFAESQVPQPETQPTESCGEGMCIFVAVKHGYCQTHHGIRSNTGLCQGCKDAKTSAELGDREPSLSLQKIAERMAVAIGEKLEQVIKGEECKVLNLTEVVYELLRTHFGAAQEVSPPSPELAAKEINAIWLKWQLAYADSFTGCDTYGGPIPPSEPEIAEIIKRHSGDTRELKAALTEAEKIVLGLIDKTATQEIVIREAQRAMVRWRVLLG
jgi:hypothetical protein